MTMIKTKLKRNKTKIDDTAKEISKEVKSPINENIESKVLFPSGSTLLNLACSDDYRGAYGIGKVINLIGDSSSGKSFLALSCLAECSNNKNFDEYDFYYDDAEEALEFDINKLFGKNLLDRMLLDIKSKTIEDFYGNIIHTIRKDKPFIYILDSLDSVSSSDEKTRAKTYGDGNIPDGSYKMEKPKLVSEILRVITSDIKQKEALVMIVSQTRDNIGFGAMFSPKVRSGGKALEFYSCHTLWLAIKSRMKEKNREIGVIIEAKITKNKLTGKRRTVTFPINYYYGVDDIGSCIDFLIEEKYWDKNKNKIVAKDFNIEMSKKKLIVEIEQKNLENELRKITADVWNSIEDSIKTDRKPKY